MLAKLSFQTTIFSTTLQPIPDTFSTFLLHSLFLYPQDSKRWQMGTTLTKKCSPELSHLTPSPRPFSLTIPFSSNDVPRGALIYWSQVTKSRVHQNNPREVPAPNARALQGPPSCRLGLCSAAVLSVGFSSTI